MSKIKDLLPDEELRNEIRNEVNEEVKRNFNNMQVELQYERMAGYGK